MTNGYNIEIISPEAAAEMIHRMRGPGNMNARRTVALPGGFELSGEFFLTARDEKSGEVEWEHAEKNLITDYGRRLWMESRWSSNHLGFAPSLETPHANRYSISTDGSQCVYASALVPTNNATTHTKTYSTTFVTPAANRTLGTIAFGRPSGTMADTNFGLRAVASFVLLTPPKTQTTTQTLEVTYRVSMNPIA